MFPRGIGMTTPRQSPSVSHQSLIFGGQIGQFRPRTLLGSFDMNRYPTANISLVDTMYPGTIEEHGEFTIATNQTQLLEGPGSNSRPPTPVGSQAGNRPNQAYNRYNEGERKEREATAEDWIQAEVRRRIHTDRKRPAPNPAQGLVKPESFLYEYALYAKNHSFVEIVRKAIVGMIISDETFACCLRGTPSVPQPGTPETDGSSQTDRAGHIHTAQVMVEKIVRDYLEKNKATDEMIEQVVGYTFSGTKGIFSGFITAVEQQVFNQYEGLPAYGWEKNDREAILKKDSRIKGSVCSRVLELEILTGYLNSCDRFFKRVNRTMAAVATERMTSRGEELLNMHQVINRVRQMEKVQTHILTELGDINKSLDKHEEELVDAAYNTFTSRKEASDKELILKNLNWPKKSAVHKCVDIANSFLVKNGVKTHTSIYSVNVDRRTCKASFNSERDKKEAENVLARIRRNSKGKSTVSTARPDAKTFTGDVRPAYNVIKQRLFAYWNQFCAVHEREDLIVSEDIWNKNIFVINRVTGKGRDMKVFYEFTDPSNRESFLVLNPDQNPFDVLDMNEEVPNAFYRKAAGSRAKTLNNAGIHTLKK